jgi:hypothetical protein
LPPGESRLRKWSRNFGKSLARLASHAGKEHRWITSNVGLAAILALASLAALFIWINPSALVWIAGKMMARRSQIIAGRDAKAVEWAGWCALHGIERRHTGGLELDEPEPEKAKETTA